MHIFCQQPVKEQFGEDFFLATEVSVDQLEIGNEVFVFDHIGCKYERYTVVGFGDGSPVNGLGRKDIPYVNKYGDEESGYAWNPNNYIMNKTIRLCV